MSHRLSESTLPFPHVAEFTEDCRTDRFKCIRNGLSAKVTNFDPQSNVPTINLKLVNSANTAILLPRVGYNRYESFAKRRSKIVKDVQGCIQVVGTDFFTQRHLGNLIPL